MERTFEVAPGITAIDTVMCGRERVTSAYLVAADEPALVETGPTTSLEAVIDGLKTLGVGAEDLAHIVVTHIHLDHAGGAGALAARFPKATVWVHERGAPHLADPSRLVASATKVYGEEQMAELFGPVEPVPGDRLRAVRDGDKVSLGGRALEIIATPGHASHHVCIVDQETSSIFVGDALGVFLPDVRILRPATPPPEFDLELAVESINKVMDRQPARLLFSHFGPAEEVVHLCSLAVRRARKWTEIVEQALQETDDIRDVVRILKQRTATELNPAVGERAEAVADRYELLSSYEMNAKGLMRYVQKKTAS